MRNTLEEAVEAILGSVLSQMYTAMPCRVIRVNENNTVDVQPLINAVTPQGAARERPILLGVPLQQPASGTSAINIPIHEEDTVLCVFSMRGMDAFKAGDGKPAAPTDFRMFDKRDAIAIPGIFPFDMHPNLKRVLPFNPNALSLTQNIGTPLESIIELKDDGEINMVSPVKVNITAPLIGLNGAT